MGAWQQIADEAREVFGAAAPFELPAYSEFMPAPYVGLKPAEPGRLLAPALGEAGLAVTEYEERLELRPGLDRVAEHLVSQMVKLVRGGSREFSRTLLADNPAWPEALARAAPALALEPFVCLLPLALSRTQDDKGRVLWTLFGASHEGPERAFWRSFDGDARPFSRLLGWALGAPALEIAEWRRWGLRVLPRSPDPDFSTWSEPPPEFARPLILSGAEPMDAVRAVLTFEPFARLPAHVQRGYLEGAIRLLPHPATLVFFEHRSYRKLSRQLPRAMQVPLLHLYPRSAPGHPLRIPQSGWLDEKRPGDQGPTGGHRMARTVVRTHRWQRLERGAEPEEAEKFADHVTVALFSTAPDDLGLYGKPMARNAQVWTEDYQLVLDGPIARPEDLARAEALVRPGGRFGYRLLYPAMRAGARTLYWHRPLVARLDPTTGKAVVPPEPLLGYATAERIGTPPLELAPQLLDRHGHREAVNVNHDPGQARRTNQSNARKLLEFSELTGPLEPSFARGLLDVAKDASLDAWLAGLPSHAADPQEGYRLATELRSRLAPPTVPAPGADGVPASRTYSKTRTRAFEERLWRTIDLLAEGEFRDKDNADPIAANEGRHGGKLGETLSREAAKRRDNDRLADWLHQRYRELIDQHGMRGKAFVADHRFKWETDFAFQWMRGWAANQSGHAHERNVVVVIPGRDTSQAVVMADHYDTAYMEDLYDPSRGGDRLRAAAAGADDNHSATAALLAAAEVLLPLSRDGQLARSVWLVHLTGEEFPSDCLGARALARAAVERRLELHTSAGPVDLSGTRIAGAFVLDMIAHNNDRDRDVFQIAPGEGDASARLAALAHRCNVRWNRSVPIWNREPERKGRGRATRIESAEPPPIAEHLALAGEIRPEWHPRSALYNTDGQIFSDVGVPVVLFMENYDIRRTGYHDTHDTMANIDLDYAAALTAIAVETVTEAASSESL